ncbi:MAG: RES domain-containing protein, partial [Mesorhizobium sp.]
TLLRNPQRLMVASTDIVSRSATSLVSVRPLRVVRLHGAGLQMVGTDNAVSTGPYEPCGLWSDALWDHKDQPDGLAYQSRHDSSEICLALLQRANVRLSARETLPLSQTLRTVADVLDIFGKSVSEPPE